MLQEPTPFVQEALLRIFAEQYSDEGITLVVFLTDEARKRNWVSQRHFEEANFEKGLRERLQELQQQYGGRIAVKSRCVPKGEREEEIWEIFEAIEAAVERDDRVVLDITHSFRYLPMLMVVALHYSRFLKENVQIERILYGAMEALGAPGEVAQMPVEKRIVPIFDLTILVSLLDWSIAIEQFLQTGNAAMLRDLSGEQLKRWLAPTKGQLGGKLRGLTEALAAFSGAVVTCRGPQIRPVVEKVATVLPEAKQELELLPPFKPLFGRIQDRFTKMDLGDEVCTHIEVAQWCADRGLIQQGLTILREAMVNAVIDRVLQQPDKLDDKAYRDDAECILNAHKCERSDELLAGRSYDVDLTTLRDLWRQITEYRNDINHAGWGRHNKHAAERFKKDLPKFVSKMRQLLCET